MVSFPNCKINLGLNITSKRADGYHNLETVFYPIELKDVLEVIQSTTFSFACTGLPVEDATSNNLCVKAYQLLKKDFPGLPPVAIHLHKAIPMGAGLGGGSADGAFMLTLLNKKFRLGITEEKLTAYALLLGSDCPFFIINKTCFATGRGEKLKPITIDLSAYTIVIINPGIHISTKEAFATLTPTEPAVSIKEIIKQPITAWKDLLKNDFETTILPRYAAIAEIKQTLYRQGALYASMTGTGSTVYGIFKKGTTIKLNLPEEYLVREV